MGFHPPAPVPHSRPLSSLQFVLTIARNPLEIWGRAAYSQPVLRADWLSTPTFIVNDPPAIRHVMVENAKNYVMQPLRQRLLRPILRDGLLTAEGELWKRTRRSLAPVFAPRNTAGLAPAMAQCVTAYAKGLAGRTTGTLDIAEEMTVLTYEILQATLFSGDIAGEPREFGRAVGNLLRAMGRIDPLDVLDAPTFLPRATRILGQRSLHYFRRVIAATIERREALLRTNRGSAPRDLLTLLLQVEGLTRAEVEDNLITFIGAGHETTARALAWTLYLLSQAPDERVKVEAELDALLPSAGDPSTWAGRLPRTRAVLEESMRLYPPAPSLNRAALAADRVGNLSVPAGATVLVMPWVLHRHEQLWDAPLEFRPERFLPGRREAIDRYQFLPFGIGPRVCIGQAFALQEAVIALALLLSHFRFEFAGRRAPWPVQRITVQPEGGIPMRVSPR